MHDFVPPPYTLYTQINTSPVGTISFISTIAFRELSKLIIPKFF